MHSEICRRLARLGRGLRHNGTGLKQGDNDAVEVFRIKIGKKQVALFLIAFVAFGLLLRLYNAYNTVHYFDLDYYVDWSTGVHDGLFNAYDHVRRLDYPPLYLFPLYLAGFFVKMPGVQSFGPYLMLVLKFFPIIFDTATIVLIYFVLRRHSRAVGLLCAAIWSVNPAIIFNCANWGQTDSLMIFMLLLCFYTLENKRPVWAGVLFGLACLTKFQCAYFAPVFLLELLSKNKISKSLASLGAGAATGLLVFLPFMLQSGWDLPFRVYFGGFGKYAYATFNAANIYGASGLNGVLDNTPLVGGFTIQAVSVVFALVILAGTVLAYAKGKNRCPWTVSFLLMQSIFMFMTRMHERYQIPALIFCLVASMRNRSGQLFVVYLLQSVMVFFNQFFLFTRVVQGQDTAWFVQYDTIFIVLSVLNVLLYVYSFYVSVKTLLSEPPAARAESSTVLPPTESISLEVSDNA